MSRPISTIPSRISSLKAVPAPAILSSSPRILCITAESSLFCAIILKMVFSISREESFSFSISSFSAPYVFSNAWASFTARESLSSISLFSFSWIRVRSREQAFRYQCGVCARENPKVRTALFKYTCASSMVCCARAWVTYSSRSSVNPFTSRYATTSTSLSLLARFLQAALFKLNHALNTTKRSR